MNMRQSKALLERGDTAGDEISDESSLHAQDTKATIHYISALSGASSTPPIAVPSACGSTPPGLAKRRKR